MTTYHTILESDEHRDVHHNNENCHYGKQIKPEHRKDGPAGRPLCDECKKL